MSRSQWSFVPRSARSACGPPAAPVDVLPSGSRPDSCHARACPCPAPPSAPRRRALCVYRRIPPRGEAALSAFRFSEHCWPFRSLLASFHATPSRWFPFFRWKACAGETCPLFRHRGARKGLLRSGRGSGGTGSWPITEERRGRGDRARFRPSAAIQITNAVCEIRNLDTNSRADSGRRKKSQKLAGR